MKKTLVIALLVFATMVNCVAFAADTTTNDSTTDETVKVEKAERPEAPAKPGKAPVKPGKPEEAPAMPEKPENAPAMPEKPENAPAKPEKPEEAPVKPEEPENAPAVPEEPENAPADSEEAVEEDKTQEKPEKEFMDKKGFHEKKEEMKKEKPGKKEYMKGIKDLFKHCDKETRHEILDEIAEIKREDKDNSVDAFIGGEAVDFEKYDNIKPIIHKGSALVPVRAVTEAYGATVEWDEETQTITITKDENVIVLQIGSLTATVNGEEKELTVAPEIHKGRTLVPIRFVAEAFSLDVDWDNDSRTIVVE